MYTSPAASVAGAPLPMLMVGRPALLCAPWSTGLALLICVPVGRLNVPIIAARKLVNVVRVSVMTPILALLSVVTVQMVRWLATPECAVPHDHVPSGLRSRYIVVEAWPVVLKVVAVGACRGIVLSAVCTSHGTPAVTSSWLGVVPSLVHTMPLITYAVNKSCSRESELSVYCVSI